MLKLFHFLLKHKSLLGLLVLASIIAAMLEGVGLALVFPVLQGAAQMTQANYPFPLNKILAVFSSMDLTLRLQVVAVLLLIVTIVKNIFVYTADLLNSRIQLIVIRHFRVKCMNELMRAGISYFNKRRASDFQIVIDGYTESVTGAIVGLVGTALPQFFTMMILLVFLFILSWKLTLASLLLVGIVSLALHQISRNILLASKIVYEARMNFNRKLLDIIHGMKLIRIFGREEHITEEFHGQIEAYNRARFQADKLIKMVAPTFESIGIGMLAVILFVGSFFIVANGSPWLGVLLTFVVILTRMIGPVKTLNHVRATIIEKIPILQEITRLLSPDEKEYVKNGSITFEGLKQGFEFSNVSFRYNAPYDVVLRKVSFKVPKGFKLGIVGPSGSGKSTLIELLLRFYDPQEGKISVDGEDLKEFDIPTLRRKIGVVSQDVFLFHDTIGANISFAKPDATFDKIKDAARKAYIDEFIESLPMGYQTLIGERGVLLSGGQRQRLAIARAILTDPDILIFDEATSALDSESEKFVQKAIETISRDKTVISIAHRLSTVFNSDEIIVMEKGFLVEAGKHAELMAHNGIYAKLVKMQELEKEILKEEENIKL